MDQAASTHPLLNELAARGLLHQTTGDVALAAHLASPRNVYGGFDPTRDSLTIGNLVALTLLRRFQLAGHRPIVLAGGGTGLIGDPSGKDAERTLLDREQVEANVRGQREIFERIVDFSGSRGALLLDNSSWLGGLGYLEVLRDIGKHFSVNMMIQKDSVRTRLEGRDHGISYTEFSYMILQAYDFAYLSREHGVTVQLGGSDQWGNIVAGVDLARRLHQTEVFGVTAPLLTKADGGKFGKTESGAVWLSAKYTSPYAFYQFWINAADEDIARFTRVFSFRPIEELEARLAEHSAQPAARTAQRLLAEELTELLHGPSGLADARAASEALFSGDVRVLSPTLLSEAFAGAPSVELTREQVVGLPLADVLVAAAVAKSKREARQFLESGAISLSGERAGDATVVGDEHVLHGQTLLIRRGKKTWHVVRLRT
ncbi:MAG TPA: tyrosine--tRNA ligase [Polyangiaceae bacterium]|nr:tyrosine--tRNA ligase [Polyangiaceae bacterium]